MGFRQYDCYKCKDGYVASEFSNCVTEREFTGCLKLRTNPAAFDREECTICDFYEGYAGYPSLTGCRKQNSIVEL
jgi:hypothetical protein